MSGLEHYIIQTILIIYCLLYLSIAFTLSVNPTNTVNITNKIKISCIFNNAALATIFTAFYFLNVIHYNNSYSDEFVLILISYHIYTIFNCLFIKEGIHEVKFSTNVINMFMCMTIAFGTFIFLL